MDKSYLASSQTRSNPDRDTLGRIVAFLRRTHTAKTAENVAATTGYSENTVKKWLRRTSVPNGEAMLTLAVVYGPEFMAAAWPRACGWLSEAVIAERQKRLDARQAEIDAERRELRL